MNTSKTKKRIRTYNVQDYKDDTGLWVRSFLENTPTSYNYFYTTADTLWLNVKKRCKGLQYPQSYGQSNNLFEGFQQFAEWCNSQFGYGHIDDNGRRWCLDKDILVRGNKNYGPDLCLFVPERINNLILDRRTSTSRELPLGCVYNKLNRNYNATMSHKAASLYMGTYESPMEAHRAWQKAKAMGFWEAYQDNNLGTRLQEAMLVYYQRLIYDIENQLETKNLS